MTNRRTQMVKVVSGGGILGNKVRSSQSAAKVEPRAKAINPASVAQQGIAAQFRKAPLVAGQGYQPKPEGSAGVANSHYVASPYGVANSGRTIFPAGTQSRTPSVKERPKGREILGDFGLESKRR
jgi:hypothetical protein